MRKIFLIISLLPFVTFAQTSTEGINTTSFAGNVYKGNWNPSLSIDHSFRKYQDETIDNNSTFVANLNVEYFFIDYLSAGLSFYFENDSSADAVAFLGPSLTWYFYSQDKIALSLGAIYNFGFTDATFNSRLSGTFYTSYFITPSVSFGPYLTTAYIWNVEGSSNSLRVTLGLTFGIYL